MTAIVAPIAFVMIAGAILLTMFRLFKGPHPVDRVLCLDFLSVSAAALISIQAIWSEQSVYSDFALLISIIAFLGTTTFARYIEGFEKGDRT